MILELADYERAPDEVRSTPADLAAALFADPPLVHAHVAADASHSDLVGYALWYVTYSTWTGRHGIWLEDLYVRPHARQRGVGRALLARLGQECRIREYRRLEWWVLDWNSPALRFYESLGARPMTDWTVHRVDGAALARLASESRTGGRQRRHHG